MSGGRSLKAWLPRSWREAYWTWDNGVRLRAEQQVYRLSAGQILAGPFKGMRYIDRATGSLLAPKILGTYEKELFPIVESIIDSRPDGLIDVGAAEGYYAVGFLRQLAGLRCIAFESGEAGRGLLGQLAALNGVADRIDVRGHCGVDDLRKALGECRQPPVVIVDIEGGEKDVLDPVAIPGLRNCPILVEAHDTLVPDCSRLMEERFSPTHRVQCIRSAERTAADVGIPVEMPNWKLRRILRERPVPMNWFWMVPKAVVQGV